jgi:hypothetical protein
MKHPWLASFALTLVACGTSSPHGPQDPLPDGPPGDSSTGMSVTDFLAAYYGKACPEAFTCMSSFVAQTTGDTFADEWGSSVSDCEANALDPDEAAAVQAEIAAHHIVYDPSETAACLAGVTFSTCMDFWTNGPRYPDACYAALYGLIPDGGACVIDWDCAGTDTTDSICTANKCTPDPSARRASAHGFQLGCAR